MDAQGCWRLERHQDEFHLAGGAQGSVNLGPLDALLLWALAAQRRWPRRELTALLWPQSTPEAGSNSLKQRLYRIRRQVGSHHPLVSNGEVVSAHSALVLGDSFDPRQNLDQEAGDIWHDWAHASGFGSQAQEWMEVQRAKWIAVRVEALANRRDALKSERDPQRALTYAVRLAALDPLSDAALRELAVLRVLDGDPAGAWAAYDAQTRLRQDHLNLGEDTALAQFIAQSAGSKGSSAPASERLAQWSLMRPPDLVGRHDEIRWLEEHWAPGRRILLLGGGGIGKSRLAATFCDRHDIGLRIKVRPGDASRPFGLIRRLVVGRADLQPQVVATLRSEARDVLASLDPMFGPADPTVTVEQVQSAVAELLDGLAAVWIDDLQHADDSSLELLATLTERGHQTAWLFCSRPWRERPEGTATIDQQAEESEIDSEPTPPTRPSLYWLREARGVLRLVVGPLPMDQAAELLQRVLPESLHTATWLQPLYRRTRGHPLFLLETVRYMMARSANSTGAIDSASIELPATVRVVVKAAVDALSQQALALVRIAALSGADFSPGLAAVMLQRPMVTLIDSWNELIASQLLADEEQIHDVVRDVLIAEVPAPIRRSLHLQLGYELEKRQAPDGVVAVHLEAGGAHREAAEAYRKAARTANRQGRVADEAKSLDQVAQCLQAAGEFDKAFDARADRIEPLVYSVGDAAERSARELLVFATTPLQRLKALTQIGHTLIHRAAFAEVLPLVQECSHLAHELGETRLESIALRRIGIALGQLGRPAEAVQVFEKAHEQLLGELSPNDRALFLLDQAQVVQQAGQRSRAASLFQESARLLAESGDALQSYVCAANLTLLWHNMGNAEGALSELETLIGRDGLQVRSGSIWLQLAVRRAMAMIDLGRFSGAIDILEPTIDGLHAQQHAAWAAIGAGSLAAAWAAVGEFPRGLQVLDRLPDSGIGSVRASLCLMRARLLAPADPRRLTLCDEGLAQANLSSGSSAAMRLQVERSRHAKGPESFEALEQAAQACRQQEMFGVLMEVLGRRIELQAGSGQGIGMANDLDEFISLMEGRVPPGACLPDALLGAARGAQRLGREIHLERIGARFRQWLATALSHTDARWHRGLLTRSSALPELLRQFS